MGEWMITSYSTKGSVWKWVDEWKIELQRKGWINVRYALLLLALPLHAAYTTTHIDPQLIMPSFIYIRITHVKRRRSFMVQ